MSDSIKRLKELAGLRPTSHITENRANRLNEDTASDYLFNKSRKGANDTLAKQIRKHRLQAGDQYTLTLDKPIKTYTPLVVRQGGKPVTVPAGTYQVGFTTTMLSGGYKSTDEPSMVASFYFPRQDGQGGKLPGAPFSVVAYGIMDALDKRQASIGPPGQVSDSDAIVPDDIVALIKQQWKKADVQRSRDGYLVFFAKDLMHALRIGTSRGEMTVTFTNTHGPGDARESNQDLMKALRSKKIENFTTWTDKSAFEKDWKSSILPALKRTVK